MANYEAPPDLEELQLLQQARQVPTLVTHSATRAISLRLQARGDAMLFDSDCASNGQLVGVTAKGKARLLAAGPKANRCPFCGCSPVLSGAIWIHPTGSRCILADFATSDVDGWNERARNDR